MYSRIASWILMVFIFLNSKNTFVISFLLQLRQLRTHALESRHIMLQWLRVFVMYIRVYIIAIYSAAAVDGLSQLPKCFPEAVQTKDSVPIMSSSPEYVASSFSDRFLSLPPYTLFALGFEQKMHVPWEHRKTWTQSYPQYRHNQETQWLTKKKNLNVELGRILVVLMGSSISPFLRELAVSASSFSKVP